MAKIAVPERRVLANGDGWIAEDMICRRGPRDRPFEELAVHTIPDLAARVLHEGPAPTRLVWGLQSLTEFTTEVDEPLELAPGKYLIVFALAGTVLVSSTLDEPLVARIVLAVVGTAMYMGLLFVMARAANHRAGQAEAREGVPRGGGVGVAARPTGATR